MAKYDSTNVYICAVGMEITVSDNPRYINISYINMLSVFSIMIFQNLIKCFLAEISGKV